MGGGGLWITDVGRPPNHLLTGVVVDLLETKQNKTKQNNKTKQKLKVQYDCETPWLDREKKFVGGNKHTDAFQNESLKCMRNARDHEYLRKFRTFRGWGLIGNKKKKGSVRIGA